MPGRTYSSGGYRFGFGGQEKDDEVQGSGNTNTAEYWEYDSRLGRRWNRDPVTYPWQGPYTTFDNNPEFFTDPYGLYATEEKAQKAAKQYDKKHHSKNRSRIYANDKGNWAFVDEKDAHHFGKRGPIGALVHNAKKFLTDISPIDKGEVYVSTQIKVNIQKGPAKVTVPLGGVQQSWSTDKGSQLNMLTVEQTYGSVKVGPLEYRVSPLNGTIPVDPKKVNSFNPNDPQDPKKDIGGDWTPQQRLLLTVAEGPIIVPIGDIPVPVGTWKVQGDLQGDLKDSKKGPMIGLRATAETISIGGMSAEVSGGARVTLKIPNILK